MTASQHLRAARDLEQLAAWHRAQATGKPPAVRSDRRGSSWTTQAAAATIDEQPGISMKALATKVDCNFDHLRRDVKKRLQSIGYEFEPYVGWFPPKSGGTSKLNGTHKHPTTTPQTRQRSFA